MANNKKDMRVMMSEEKHEEWCTMIEELNILLTNMLTMIHDTLLVINSGKQDLTDKMGVIACIRWRPATSSTTSIITRKLTLLQWR
jgi:hypothetical protein